MFYDIENTSHKICLAIPDNIPTLKSDTLVCLEREYAIKTIDEYYQGKMRYEAYLKMMARTFHLNFNLHDYSFNGTTRIFYVDVKSMVHA